MKNTTILFILFLCLWFSCKILKYRVDKIETQLIELQVEEISKTNKILIEILENKLKNNKKD